MYAIFRTSEGEFIAELYYEQVPMTVANFVGLAEGSRPWLDLNTGSVRTEPYYNGLLFHRVIADFMIQGGSRNGLGTDGPGYAFADEFANGLRHDVAGTLSMANSGVASNGAQFFVTVAPTPWLDLVHSVFGRVVEGLANVVTISEYDTNGEPGRPLVDVVLHEVEIVRVGAAAAAFDVNAYGLPAVRGVPATLDVSADSLLLGFPQERYGWYYIFSSEDLATWAGSVLDFTFEEPEIESVDVTDLKADTDRLFFNIAAADYAPIPDQSVGLIGKRLVLDLIRGSDAAVFEIILEITAVGPVNDPIQDGFPGTGTVNGGAPGDLDYFWGQYDRVGEISFIIFEEMTSVIVAHLHFIDDQSGTVTAFYQGDPPTPYPFYGTFLLEDT